MATLAKLSTEYQAYKKRIQAWHTSLLDAARALSDEVEALLGPTPKAYQDLDGLVHYYVDVYTVGPSSPAVMHPLSKEFFDAMAAEALTFAVGVTLDDSSGSSPRRIITVPMAVQFRDGVAEYARWDVAAKSAIPGLVWSQNPTRVAASLVDAIDYALTRDPTDGPSMKPPVGFLSL